MRLLHLPAAAAYQLADYPAMALGHLRRVPDDQPFSVLLREFLRGYFPATLEAIRGFWEERRALEIANRIDPSDLTTHTFQHVVMCIGTVCSYLRTGNDAMIERALSKLENLAGSLLHSRDPYSYFLHALSGETFWPRRS